MSYDQNDASPSEGDRSADAEADSGQETGVTASRRAALAAIGSVATSGCVRRVGAILDRRTPNQVSLTIKAPPADDDVRATRIARFLATRLTEVGIDAQVVPLTHEELRRDVLLNHNFDLFVGQLPEIRDPDRLRSLLHSQFDAESGWQNPFGYANLSVDDLLVKQRKQSGSARRETVTEIQSAVARDQPFTVVALPYEVRAMREDVIGGWGEDGLHTVLGYLSIGRDTAETEVAGDSGTATESSLTAVGPTEVAPTAATPTTTTSSASAEMSTPTASSIDSADEIALRVTVTDARMTENLNPLAVEFRGGGFATDLLYDRLARAVGGELRPWLAAEWDWQSAGTSPVADVTLREGLRWHDGEPLTAEDVAFTYRFLQDTSLGSLATPAPAPRFRGRSSLIDSVEAVDDRRFKIRFSEVATSVAVRAFNVPVLPEHVWGDLTGQATVAGIDTKSPVTEALVWNNGSPVGSGPFAYRAKSYRESLTFEPFDQHFLARGGDDLPERYAGLPSFDSLRFVVVPSSRAAVELLGSGEAHATASPVHPSLVPAIGRDESLSLSAKSSQSLYHVGYNLRRSPLRNPNFRRAVARLLDKAYIAENVFKGYARPVTSPLVGTPWLAPELRWDGKDPELPFPGTDGTLDVSRARESFAEAGYRFTDDGRLVSA